MLDGIDVLINVGDGDTAHTGGKVWEDPDVSSAVKGFVHRGGGLIGVGEPGGHQYQGRYLQLSAPLGVEKETGFTLNYDKYNWDEHRDHFILTDCPDHDVDFGEGKKSIFALEGTEILIQRDKEVQMAAHEYGKGRGVYISGLPYSFVNNRVLYRAILWAAIAAYRQENADIYHRRLADPRRVPAVQMYPPVPRRLQARPQCYRHCAAQLLLQSPAKVFCLCGTAPVRDGPRRSNVPLKRRQILLDKKNKYWQLFLSTFKLSACTFGGGFVIIPLMRERFVKELRWIEEEEMLDLTAIAQSSPGSIAINASILVGYHVAGIPGALITVVGAALPPLIIISIISAFYQAFRSNKYVSMAMAGMLAGVAAVVFDVVINMAWPILKKKRWLPIAVMLAAFLATRFFSVNIILIILVCGVIGALDTLYLQKREDDK